MVENSKKLNVVITLLRVFIGWHFLYEGIMKLYNPDWTAFGYLASAQGPFKLIFAGMASESAIGLIDTLNMAALVVVGITLLTGVFERIGAIIGIGLLAMYYLAHPPFPGLTQLNVEGNYWLVNKNLIELMALLVIYNYPTGHYFGLNYFKNRRNLKIEAE